jgi:hypothetical protein
MPSHHQSEMNKTSLFDRFSSNPRIQRVVQKSQRVMGNVLEKYNSGVSITKSNATDTFKEMSKFFSITEAEQAFFYNKNLAKEAHEELIGVKIRHINDTFKSIMHSQVDAIFDRNSFSIDNSADDDSEDQE